MIFDEILGQVLQLLQRQGRVSYLRDLRGVREGGRR